MSSPSHRRTDSTSFQHRRTLSDPESKKVEKVGVGVFTNITPVSIHRDKDAKRAVREEMRAFGGGAAALRINAESAPAAESAAIAGGQRRRRRRHGRRHGGR